MFVEFNDKWINSDYIVKVSAECDSYGSCVQMFVAEGNEGWIYVERCKSDLLAAVRLADIITLLNGA